MKVRAKIIILTVVILGALITYLLKYPKSIPKISDKFEESLIKGPGPTAILKPKNGKHSKAINEFLKAPEYIGNSYIPAIIHQTYKTDNIPAHLLSGHNSFHLTNTKVLHLLWTDEDISDFILEYYPEKYEFFNSLPHPILKADLFRYMVVNEFGGVYSDMDTNLLKDYKEWIPSESDYKKVEFIVGIESNSVGRIDWMNYYARELQFCQWTFASKPNHEILKNTIENSFRKLRSRTKFKDFGGKVMESTGPGIFTDNVFKHLKMNGITLKNVSRMKSSMEVDGVLVLSMTAFSPGVGHSGVGSIWDKDALVNHKFAGSWK